MATTVLSAPAGLVDGVADNVDLALQDPGGADLRPFALGGIDIRTTMGGETVATTAAAIHSRPLHRHGVVHRIRHLPLHVVGVTESTMM